jgi:ATP-dependent Clp protease ATP-binding subunit ClpA
VGAKILTQRRGASQERLRAEVEKIIHSRMEDTWCVRATAGLAALQERVVARALEEARAMDCKEVGTEHLLLGLLAEKGCTAQQALRAWASPRAMYGKTYSPPMPLTEKTRFTRRHVRLDRR